MPRGDLVSEAVAEVQGGRVTALSPTVVGRGDALRRCPRQGHDFEVHPGHQFDHLRRQIASPRDERAVPVRIGPRSPLYRF